MINDEPVDNLPSGVISVRFADNFNQSIDNLPDTVEFIQLDFSSFDRKIKKLPNNFRSIILHIDYPYKKELEYILPKNANVYYEG